MASARSLSRVSMSSPWVSRRRRPSSTSSNVGSAIIVLKSSTIGSSEREMTSTCNVMTLDETSAENSAPKRVDALFDLLRREPAASAPQHASEDAGKPFFADGVGRGAGAQCDREADQRERVALLDVHDGFGGRGGRNSRALAQVALSSRASGCTSTIVRRSLPK